MYKSKFKKMILKENLFDTIGDKLGAIFDFFNDIAKASKEDEEEDIELSSDFKTMEEEAEEIKEELEEVKEQFKDLKHTYIEEYKEVNDKYLELYHKGSEERSDSENKEMKSLDNKRKEIKKTFDKKAEELLAKIKKYEKKLELMKDVFENEMKKKSKEEKIERGKIDMYQRKFNKINEALPLNYAKQITKSVDWKARHDEWFGGKPRVYVPLVQKLSDEENVASGIELMIKDILEQNGYELIDYQNARAKKKGDDRGQEVKLGKLLQRFNKELLAQFEKDPKRFAKGQADKQPLVVISRHPYDIAGMTQDRKWWNTSCKDLGIKNVYGEGTHEGAYARYIKHEVAQLLIAYLIKPDDKNIKNPIARVILVPYANRKGEIAYVVAKRVYGSSGSLEKVFIDTVEKWLLEKQGRKTGKFNINPKVYNDNMPGSFLFKNEDGTYAGMDIEEIWEDVLKDCRDNHMKDAIIIYFMDEKGDDFDPSTVTDIDYRGDGCRITINNDVYRFYDSDDLDSILRDTISNLTEEEVYQENIYILRESPESIPIYLDRNRLVNFLYDDEDTIEKAFESTMNQASCSHCNGTGKDPNKDLNLMGEVADCLVCGGRGYVKIKDNIEDFTDYFNDEIDGSDNEELITFVLIVLDWEYGDFGKFLDGDLIYDHVYQRNWEMRYEIYSDYQEISNTGYFVEYY